MTKIETEAHPYLHARVVRGVGADVALVERDNDRCTLQWPSRRLVSESLELMKPIARSADKAWLLSVNRGGSSIGTSGETAEAAEQLEGLSKRPESISRVHVDCDVRDIGEVILSFEREVVGLDAPSGALSLTAPVGKFGRECLREFFTSSAPSSLESEYDQLVEAAEMMQPESV